MSWPSDVRKSDLRVDYYRGSGPGGQNKNKRDTACRITHLPTGIATTAEEHRTQGLNRVAAFRRLARRLTPLMEEAFRAARNSLHHGTPPPRAPAGEKAVRTYHEKRGEVRDARVPDLRWSCRGVLDGDGLDAVLVSVRRAGVKRDG